MTGKSSSLSRSEENGIHLNACLAEVLARLKLLLSARGTTPFDRPANDTSAAESLGGVGPVEAVQSIPNEETAMQDLLEAIQNRQEAASSLSEPSRLQMLCQAFSLSEFECDLLLLCALAELDLSAAFLCSRWHGSLKMKNPSFALACKALPDAHWNAISMDGPLRRWHLIDAGAGDLLVLSPLKIDERVLHYLMGGDYLDARLNVLAEPVLPSPNMAASHVRLAERITQAWSLSGGPGGWVSLPLICLLGSSHAAKRAISARACASLGVDLYCIRASDIPANATDRECLVRLWEREAALSRLAVMVRCEDLEEKDGAAISLQSLAPAISFLRRLGTMALATSNKPLPLSDLSGRTALTLQAEVPSLAEQEELWRLALDGGPWKLNGEIEQAVRSFSLSSQQIADAGAGILSEQNEGKNGSDAGALGPILRRACKAAARPRLESLAERIVPHAVWEDLVLPEPQKQILMEIESQVRHSDRVYRKWGFASKGDRGLGISALFAGESGTGKTMSAEVLAGKLDLDLYRIDLSQVVNKYIGETEKNLRRVFDAAEGGGCILLFDEADALFGKRSEVKDSHDRYANIEVGYLLQRMEAFRGLAILTTNIRSALDSAFLRRIRFIVQFPFPGDAERKEIWKRIFPKEMPSDGLDYDKLSRLNVTGGSIRNMALHSAFLAAEEGCPVGMRHLLRAAKVEAGKLERPLSGAEIAGWV